VILFLAVSMMDSMNSCMEEYVRSGLKLGANVSSVSCDDANDGKPRIKISVANAGKVPLAGITLSVTKATTPPVWKALHMPPRPKSHTQQRLLCCCSPFSLLTFRPKQTDFIRTPGGQSFERRRRP
jgi:hypothetical protein